MFQLTKQLLSLLLLLSYILFIVISPSRKLPTEYSADPREKNSYGEGKNKRLQCSKLILIKIATLNPYFFFSIWQTALNYYVTRGADNISEIVLLLSRDPLGNFFADPIGDFISRFIFRRIYKMVHRERCFRDMVKPLNCMYIYMYVYGYKMKFYHVVDYYVVR